MIIIKRFILITGISLSIFFGHLDGLYGMCKTSVNAIVPYDHVALVFEFVLPDQDQDQNPLTLRMVHFGGDGQSTVREGFPCIDNASETLRKTYRGEETSDFNSSRRQISPLYVRECAFVVPIKDALNAFSKVEEDQGLNYFITGRYWLRSFLPFLRIKPHTYNCCTYADRVLADAGIELEFRTSYKLLNNAKTFLDYCKRYEKKERQTEFREIEEYVYDDGLLNAQIGAVEAIREESPVPSEISPPSVHLNAPIKTNSFFSRLFGKSKKDHPKPSGSI
ncbi:MAG: hypothetical protein B7Y25_07890 [Alphaproteobacteria bacterium 16-39-46]|nr:MAG: hypothetical protein B7Y25_07890 [Alphaproteobacteria bacterium 16-39-46]